MTPEGSPAALPELSPFASGRTAGQQGVGISGSVRRRGVGLRRRCGSAGRRPLGCSGRDARDLRPGLFTVLLGFDDHGLKQRVKPWVSMQPWSESTAVVGEQDGHCVCTCVRVGERVLATSASKAHLSVCAMHMRIQALALRTSPHAAAIFGLGASSIMWSGPARDAGKFDGAGGIGIKGYASMWERVLQLTIATLDCLPSSTPFSITTSPKSRRHAAAADASRWNPIISRLTRIQHYDENFTDTASANQIRSLPSTSGRMPQQAILMVFMLHSPSLLLFSDSGDMAGGMFRVPLLGT
jgi:hypothetical protein